MPVRAGGGEQVLGLAQGRVVHAHVQILELTEQLSGGLLGLVLGFGPFGFCAAQVALIRTQTVQTVHHQLGSRLHRHSLAPRHLLGRDTLSLWLPNGARGVRQTGVGSLLLDRHRLVQWRQVRGRASRDLVLDRGGQSLLL